MTCSCLHVDAVSLSLSLFSSSSSSFPPSTDKLEKKCDELTSYHQTLLMEKEDLDHMLKETQQRMDSMSISGSESGYLQKCTTAAEPNLDHLKKEVRLYIPMC